MSFFEFKGLSARELMSLCIEKLVGVYDFFVVWHYPELVL